MMRRVVSMCSVVVLLGTGVYAQAEQPAATGSASFIIKKQSTENLKSLSKDAIKERMGEAVRDAMHALLDAGSSVVELQRTQAVPLEQSCTLHSKILGLLRTFSNIAESLIDGHYVYKKNHKVRLEKSLLIVRDGAQACKQAAADLAVSSSADRAQQVASTTTSLVALADNIAADPCLKVV